MCRQNGRAWLIVQQNEQLHEHHVVFDVCSQPRADTLLLMMMRGVRQDDTSLGSCMLLQLRSGAFAAARALRSYVRTRDLEKYRTGSMLPMLPHYARMLGQ